MWLIEIGNTKTAWCWLEEGVLQEAKRFHNQEWDTSELMLDLSRGPAEAIYLASVVPEAQARLLVELAPLPVPVHSIDYHTAGLLPYCLQTPETTGIDRLLVARAAWELYSDSPGVIIIQAGTAVTVDLVDFEGIYQGGVIMPGPTLWLAGLSAAAQLPALADASPTTHPGKSTADAILGGLAVGLPGAISAVVESLRPKKTTPILLTGGWAERLMTKLRFTVHLRPNLVLEGMAILARGRA